MFGCNAYSHIPRDERDKLDPKTRGCWFLEYGETTKAYRLYDRSRRLVFHSRDVEFNEGTPTCPSDIVVTPGHDDPLSVIPDAVPGGGGGGGEGRRRREDDEEREDDKKREDDEDTNVEEEHAESPTTPARGMCEVVPRAPVRQSEWVRLRLEKRANDVVEQANCVLEDPQSLPEALALKSEMESLASNRLDAHRSAQGEEGSRQSVGVQD